MYVIGCSIIILDAQEHFIMQPDTDCEMQGVKQHSAARKHNLRAQELRLYKTAPHAGHWHI